MFKWIRRILGLLVLLGLGLVLLLVPGSVPSSEQLRNVQAGTSLLELAQQGISQAGFSEDGLSTELSLNSVQLNQVVKSSLGDSLNGSDLEELGMTLDGNDLHLKIPLSWGPLQSYADVAFEARVENNILNLRVNSAKLGKLLIPKSVVSAYIQDRIKSSGTAVSVNQDQIQIEVPQSGFHISEARIENGDAKIRLILPLY